MSAQISIIAHIPKTAGTFFRDRVLIPSRAFDVILLDYEELTNEITRIQLKDRILLTGRNVRSWGEMIRRFRATVQSCGMLHAPAKCIIYGHIVLGWYKELFPEALFGIWTRNPIDRALSNYYHYHRLKSPDGYYKDEEDDIVKAIYHRDIDNLQSQYCGNYPISELSFVGITERLEESIKLFKRVYNVQINVNANERVNANPKNVGIHYNISSNLRTRLEKLLIRDALVYKQAVDRFDQLLNKYGVIGG